MFDENETALDRKLIRDFCRDSETAEQGKRITQVSEAAGVPIFRRRQSDTRCLTWYDADAATRMPDQGLLGDGADEPGIEWALSAGMRRASEIYADGERLARTGQLLPSDDDYLRAHVEYANYLRELLPDAVAELLLAARESAGTVIQGRPLWNIPMKFRIEYDDQCEEIRIAMPRSSGDFAEKVEMVILVLLSQQAELVHDEVLNPGLLPSWVPRGWRCFHFIREQI